MEISIVQQFIVMLFGGLAIFIWSYYLGYNKAFARYLDETEKELEQLKKEKEYQMK